MMNERKKFSLCEALREIVGSENVLAEDFERWCYSGDLGPSKPIMPDLVVRPATTQEVQKILMLANETKTPVVPRGSGTNFEGEGMPIVPGGILLETTRMNKIVNVDEDAMTVTAQAGVLWGKLGEELAKKGWRVQVAAPYFGTVGGTAANHGIGRGAAKYGPLETQILGFEVVLPNGSVIRTGSGIIQNSEIYARYGGWADLTGLFTGSIGALGVITQVAFRLHPIAEHVDYATYDFVDARNMCDAVWEIQKTGIVGLPTVTDIYVWSKYKYSGFFVKPKPGIAETVDILFEGRKKEVEQEVKIVDKTMKEKGGKYVGRYSPYGPSNRHHYPIHKYPTAHFTFTIPIKRYPEFEKVVTTIAEKYNRKISFTAQVERNCWRIYPVVMWDPSEPEDREVTLHERKEQYRTVIGEMCALPCRVTGLTEPENVMRWFGRGTYDLIRTIKKALDPNDTMYPGLLR